MINHPHNTKNERGFTIVELLVVIVVIGILAAITIVAYSGVQQKATIASLQSDLTNTSSKLKLFQVDNNLYPASITDCATATPAAGNVCLKASPGTIYQYTMDNTANPTTFCLSAVKNNASYTITNDGVTLAGTCSDYGLVLKFDAGNVASYPGVGTTWADLSGMSNNGTLMNGVGYSAANGGTLSFDGVDDYVTTSGIAGFSNSAITVSTWVKQITSCSVYCLPAGDVSKIQGIFLLGNVPFFQLQIGSSGYVASPLSTGSLGTNWHLLTGTWSTGSKIKLYIDDGSVNSQSGTVYAETINAWDNIDVGVKYSTSTYFNGSIGEVRVYGRALSASEVSQNFNTVKGRYGL